MHKGAAVLLLLATFVALCASQASVDRSALLALYNSAGGTGWTTKWNTANPSLCTGNGATVTCWDDGKVRKIDLKVNKLSGSLPTQIGLLTKMQNLILTTNALTGPIPTEICLLTDLSTLALNFNSFTGSIPTCLGNLVRLTAIILEGNRLTGSIPTQISNHPKAGEIRLSNNQLSGTLPTLWRQGVGSILLESNSLTGSIPSEIIASGVKRLRLANNKLSGSLPEVSSDSLTEYYIFSNQITGSIPTHLGANSQLQRFWAYGNKLSGSLPSQIGTAKTLFDLRVMGNSLTGTIPTTFENSKLRFIWLSQNSISGQIPSQLGNLSQLTSLRLDENMITGYIPGPVLRNPSLNDLTLSKNCLAPVGIYSGFSSNDFDSFVPNSACTPSGPFEEAASDFPLFASYRFSSDAPLADMSGNGVDLILYDPALFDETHLFGQALNPYNTALFARSFSSFGLRSRARFSLFGDFTVELLVSSTLGSNNYLFAFSSGSIETGQLLSLMLGVDGTLSLLDDDLTPLIQVAGQFSPNRVHHLAVTWNVFGQELKLYVDGTLHGQTVVSPTVPVNGFHYLYLAGSQTAIFDEANLYSAELSQADIQSKISALDWCPLLSCLGTCTPTTNGALCS